MFRVLLVLIAIGVAMATGGFVHFAFSVQARVPVEDIRGDGIIVLTGAAERIAFAAGLLGENRARRLLITGVNPAASDADLIGLIGGDAALFDCCIDIDRAALNTLGNASEARRWSTSHAFKRLIVVTSDYHMPRSLMEFTRAMPNAMLVPAPFPPVAIESSNWWRHPRAPQHYAAEYAKYVFALLRNRVIDLQAS